MAQTGIIGTHIVANEGGYSRDKSVENIREIQGKYITIVNDPLLCQMVLDMGGVPIHRINRAGLLDDQADEKGYSAHEYVTTAHTEVPDKRCLLYLCNEPGQNNLKRLGDFILEGVQTANALGRTLVCINWSYGNPEPGAWDALAYVVRAVVKGGHYIGFHEGYDIAHPTLNDCIPFLIGRFLKAQQRFGFKAIVTEFAASKTAHDGWRSWLEDWQYAALTEDAVRAVYAPHGVPLTPYTLFPWVRDFDYYNEPELKSSFANINRRYPLKDIPMTQTYPPPTTGGEQAALAVTPSGAINIRSQPNPTSGTTNTSQDVGDLLVGDEVTWYPNAKVGEWVYIDPLSQVTRKAGQDPAAKGWVSLQSGKVKFVPALLPPTEERLSYTKAEVDDMYQAVEEAFDATEVVQQKLAKLNELLTKGVPPSNGGGF